MTKAYGCWLGVSTENVLRGSFCLCFDNQPHVEVKLLINYKPVDTKHISDAAYLHRYIVY